MGERPRSTFEPIGIETVRPCLIVGDASAAIDFYAHALVATEIERHAAPTGGVGHAKVRTGDAILEIGEHPDAMGRPAAPMPCIGLRLYVTDVDATHARAMSGGATGDSPSNRLRGVRMATVLDRYGLTWWLAPPME